MSQVMLSQQTVADLDITYESGVSKEDWQGRMVLRQDGVADAAEGELNAHLEALGMDSLRDYVGWCRNYGFGLRLGKSRWQLERERALFCLEREQTAIGPSRRLGEAIARVYEGGEADWKDEALVRIHEGFAGASDREERQAMLRLLMWLDERTDLGYGGVMIPRLGKRPGNTFVEGVIALCRHHRDWQRPLDGCHWGSEHPRSQFGVLVRHLIALEGAPVFMDAAWFRGNDPIAERQQGWFTFLGRDHDICLAPEPPRLTRQMGREFVDAPAYCTIEEAMRWGQVLGQGGDEVLAQAVIDTPLGTTFRNANFWDKVIRYFVTNKELDPSCVGTVVDYLESQRFERKTVVHPDGSTERLKPVQPKLQMKGRQLGKLLRQVEAWHLNLAADDERTSALVRWHLRDEVLRWGRHKGVPNRSFAGPLHYLDLLGLGTEVDYRAWCVENGFETGLFKNAKARFQELSAGVAAADRTEDEALNEHLEVLGLSRDAYQAWCRDHGFSDRLNKNRRQRRREIRLMERIRGEDALATRRNQTRRPDETIAQIYAGEIDVDALRADYLVKIYAGFEALKGDEAKREALFELLCRVARVADLFGPGRAFSGFGDQPGNTWVDGLMALAHVQQNWIRRVADW
ncbi:MAG: hypothetical protein O7G87_10065, partial [bacterium]|nr:hypothetical protein [bacterium]